MSSPLVCDCDSPLFLHSHCLTCLSPASPSNAIAEARDVEASINVADAKVRLSSNNANDPPLFAIEPTGKPFVSCFLAGVIVVFLSRSHTPLRVVDQLLRQSFVVVSAEAIGGRPSSWDRERYQRGSGYRPTAGGGALPTLFLIFSLASCCPTQPTFNDLVTRLPLFTCPRRFVSCRLCRCGGDGHGPAADHGFARGCHCVRVHVCQA